MDAVLLGVALVLCLYIRSVYTRFKNPLGAKNEQALLQLEGKNFLSYNNITDPKDAIEAAVIPHLATGIEVIFLNGKEPKYDLEKRIIRKMLYGLQKQLKSPIIVKVRDGEFVGRSINSEFSAMLDQNKPVTELITVIDKFFEIKTPPDKPA